MIFAHRFHALVLACALLFSALAHADVILPDIEPQFVDIEVSDPTRDAGYVVGDILERTITLTIKKPYQLVEESLPLVGYEHRWRGQVSGIELVKITTEEIKHKDSTTHVLNLAYQVFTTGRTAKPAALRAEIIRIRNTQNSELLQYRIPSFSFRISPLSVLGQVNLKQELSPFHPPLQLDASREMLRLKVLLGILALSLLGLLYIFGVNAWLPRMGAPFAKAYRDIRRLPDNPEGLEQALIRVHQALNSSAEAKIFNDNLNDFLQKKPNFAVVSTEISKFLSLSAQVFFDPKAKVDLGIAPKAWLLKFCRHMRDCERGLVPEIKP